MVTTKKVLALASMSTNSLLVDLLKRKQIALQSGILIPDDAIAAIDDYCKRNKIVDQGHGCCPDCLKAHHFTVLSDYIGKARASELIKDLPGDLGHNGYYLDKEELKKI